MATTTVSARMDGELKHQAEEILDALGISHTAAINALYAQIVLCKGLPFDVKLPLGESMPTLHEISEVVRAAAQKYGLQKVTLFGSYARGHATRTSDIDLCVDKGDARGFALGGFQYDVSQALKKEVDVVMRNAGDEAFMNSVAIDEVVLYER